MKTLAYNNNSISFECVGEMKLTYRTTEDKKQVKLTSSISAANYIKEVVYETDTIEFCEYFYTILLNRANKTIGYLKVSEGSNVGTVVCIKKILQAVILSNACSVILSHNHPSGNKLPSAADKTMTNKAKQALKLLDIALLDHIIVTKDNHYSFCDEGLI
jgi:DNA repair protein RadC